MKRIGVLVSGGGSNLQALIDAIDHGELATEIGLVISNKPGVYALERARQRQIPCRVVDHRQFATALDFSQAMLTELLAAGIDLVCLAGFLRILDRCVTEHYRNRMLNIHPSLLPAFGGKGMYGHHVHEAVIAAGVKFSGATVHLVTPETDIGPIVLQDVVTVADSDTPESLAAKVLQVEHRIYPQAVQQIVAGEYRIEGLRVLRNV